MKPIDAKDITKASAVEMQWTPVKERPPKENGWYLVAIDGHEVASRLWYDCERKRWVNNIAKHIFDTFKVMSLIGERVTYKEDGCYDFHKKVTHWMTLPPLP